MGTGAAMTLYQLPPELRKAADAVLRRLFQLERLVHMGQFNATRITERLIVGGGIAGPDELQWLAAQGVTHIISAAAELDDAASAAAAGMRFLHIPWNDDGQRKEPQDFHTAYLWVVQADTQLAQSGKQAGIYCHCAAGVNRGPLMGTFLLAALSGLPGDTAWATLVGQRPQANAFNTPAYRQSCLDALALLQPFRPAGDLPEPAAAPDSPSASASEASNDATATTTATANKKSAAASAAKAVAVGDSASGHTA